MAQNCFVMQTQKKGRLKYVLLSMGIPIVIAYLFSWLLDLSVLPKNRILSYVYLYFPIACMMLLGYTLVLRKNHSLEIKNNTVIETSWTGKETKRIKVNQIHSYRRNFLQEIILLDEIGNKLLSAEANMTNFDLFQQWLSKHSIYQNKE